MIIRRHLGTEAELAFSILCQTSADWKVDLLDQELVDATSEIQDGLKNWTIFIQGTHLSCPDGMRLWDPLFDEASEEGIPRSMRDGIEWRSTCCYINMSGTTGKKALNGTQWEFAHPLTLNYWAPIAFMRTVQVESAATDIFENNTPYTTMVRFFWDWV